MNKRLVTRLIIVMVAIVALAISLQNSKVEVQGIRLDNLPTTVSAAQVPGANPSQVKAVWAQGELKDHYSKHPEGYATIEAYDTGARETVVVGKRFTYRDTQTQSPRVGYYDKASNRFTAMTADERRITTHFRPDRGESYVKGLPGSTYR